MTTLLDKFLRYVKVDTQSMDDCENVPSTEKQRVLSNMLADELRSMGASDVSVSQHNYVYATIPANTSSKYVLGFIAHVDTSPAVTDTDVKPIVTRNYDGKDIPLAENRVLSPADFPELTEHVGKTIISSDGTTLLGADDKAGVATIMQLAETLLTDNSIKHGTVKIAFTPDEEVGRGADFFDIKHFGCDGAYTIDGGALGELEYENFNAACAKVTINGVSVHPGSAKGKMVNACLVLMELNSLLPKFEIPAYTEKYEGFYHLDTINACVDLCNAVYIIRDHDRTKFEQKKAFFAKCVQFINDKYGSGTVVADVTDTYYNMKEMVLPHKHLIDNCIKAMELAGVTPKVQPIRGGTDGARLSYEGLPCPNIFTGGYNFHGRYEYIPLEDMAKVVDVMLNIVDLYKDR